MASTTAATLDQQEPRYPNTMALYNAVEELRDKAQQAYSDLIEGDGDFNLLHSQLTEVSTAASLIGGAVSSFVAAINEYL